MRNDKNLVIRVVRILPWDIGSSLTDSLREKVKATLSKKNWTFRYDKDYCRGKNSVGLLFINGLWITLDIFSDGFCVFTIHEPPQRFSSEYDFDPLILTDRKSTAHRFLLSGRHSICSIFYDTMEVARKFVPRSKRRFSASKDWENQGFSYVFSFYFIRCNISDLYKDSFNQKTYALLFPIPTDEISKTVKMDQTKTLSDYATKVEFSNMNDSLIADLPYRKIFFSWATATVAGEVPKSIAFSFCKSMRELQNAWIAAYVGDRRLDSVVRSIAEISKIEKLIDLDSQMSSVAREIGRFTSIPDSMAHSIKLRTYHVAAKQSGLDTLALAIQTKLQYIRAEINARIEKRNWNGYRTIEFILTVLTVLQAISAYKSIQLSGGLNQNEYVTIGVLVVLLVVVFLRR